MLASKKWDQVWKQMWTKTEKKKQERTGMIPRWDRDETEMRHFHLLIRNVLNFPHYYMDKPYINMIFSNLGVDFNKKKTVTQLMDSIQNKSPLMHSSPLTLHSPLFTQSFNFQPLKSEFDKEEILLVYNWFCLLSFIDEYLILYDKLYKGRDKSSTLHLCVTLQRHLLCTWQMPYINCPEVRFNIIVI